MDRYVMKEKFIGKLGNAIKAQLENERVLPNPIWISVNVF